MQPVLPDELAQLGEAAGQLAFLSAVLGGFSFSILSSLLTAEGPRGLGTALVSSAAIAAAAFLCASIMGTLLSFSPDVTVAVVPRRTLMVLLVVGMYALLIALGLCGWVRSRVTGMITSLAAFVSGLVIAWAATGF
ncbi:hypothetical protein B1759_10190 [Rubrivirga sp. SAORIC476]|uniref:hypothetical protein n=1 Tax=Rubrivirga sp. SAORIC476 TaxID=1961794 RepID=UPI000BA90853|nr:hypothetical protein [Rubrivirga sp. SAORIC476]PAP81659.1 hypothetical protein B1759_10190 [Rubrivirga sp. SAORIC476]